MIKMMEQLLKIHRDELVKAYTGHYIHGISTGLAKLFMDIADKLGLKGSRQVNCPNCVLKVCASLGKYILELEEKEKAQRALLMTPETLNDASNNINKKTQKKTPEVKNKKNKK